MKNDVIEIAKFCASKGLVPATSGNFSARIDESNIAITISGSDKAKLSEDEIMLIDYQGQALDPSQKPSAETLLHTLIYAYDPETNYVAHYHSINSSVISKVLKINGHNELQLENYEILKALSGVNTHEHREIIPIFDNDQNIARMSADITKFIDKKPENQAFHAFLIAGHGIYTWGKSVKEVIRHVDALETLLESYIAERQIRRAL